MSQNTAPTAAPTSKIKSILIGIVAALIVAAILYGVGYSQGRAQLAAQKAGYEPRLQTLQNEVATSKTELARAQNAAHLVEARAGLYRTALDLERRNFGIANTRLQSSAASLALVHGAEVNAAPVGALQKQLAATDINVATDLEAQRRQVLEFAMQLEKLTPAPPPNP